ncbi:MAG TPA: hypothetical protein VE689_01425 [Candidatus Udaeobacter sp.]|jgi:hypothetical protein|nr:hypothetical protein [Candidatus Udaeobacter sp.]
MVTLAFTPQMRKRLTRRARAMIARALPHFPELRGKTITVGYTRTHLGSASVSYRGGQVSRLIIRLKIRKLTFQTIGHELTHLVQGLAHGDRRRASPEGIKSIPGGEKQCDIWTLARDPLFCDDPPTYLRLPRGLREDWREHADEVRKLCITAIEKRRNYRLYIRWLEEEIGKLAKKRCRAQSLEGQLSLPFITGSR